MKRKIGWYDETVARRGCTWEGVRKDRRRGIVCEQEKGQLLLEASLSGD